MSAQRWVILKAVHGGPFLNSPVTWENSGTIEDDLPESALNRACYLCGSSEVVIMPENAFHPKQ